MNRLLAASVLVVAFAGCSRGTDNRRDLGSSTSTTQSPVPDPRSLEITLTPDMIQRAGIKTVAAVKGTATTRLHLPGDVEPNAYKNVDVTSLVSGRVVQVKAELGQRVMQNEVLATVYSPDLADAQTGFIEAKRSEER